MYQKYKLCIFLTFLKKELLELGIFFAILKSFFWPEKFFFYFFKPKKLFENEKKIPNSKKNIPRMNFFNKKNNIVKIFNILYFYIYDCRNFRLLFQIFIFIVIYCNIITHF